MFPSSSGGLSLFKILTGISKSLNIAKEIIPIYEQTKPMVKNISKIFNAVNSSKHKNNMTTTSNIKTNKKTITDSNSSFNNPSFFK